MSEIVAALEIWHATILEIIWTLFGVVGVYLGTRNLQFSKKDIDALNEMNGHTFAQFRVMRVIAYGHYRNDLLRLSKHCTVLAIGVISDLLPAPSRNPVKITPSGIVITLGLFTIVLLLLVASALDRRQREALEAIER